MSSLAIAHFCLLQAWVEVMSREECELEWELAGRYTTLLAAIGCWVGGARMLDLGAWVLARSRSLQIDHVGHMRTRAPGAKNFFRDLEKSWSDLKKVADDYQKAFVRKESDLRRRHRRAQCKSQEILQK